MLGTYALSAGYYDAYYLKAQKVRTLIKGDFDAAFETVDALVAPTCADRRVPVRRAARRSRRDVGFADDGERERTDPPQPAGRARPGPPRPGGPAVGHSSLLRHAHEMHDVISLTIGEPDFNTPEPITRPAIESLRGRTHYTANCGTFELRAT